MFRLVSQPKGINQYAIKDIRLFRHLFINYESLKGRHHMKKSYLNRWVYLIPTLDLIACLILFPNLPDKIPVHFDINWQPDRYGSRLELLIFPLGLLFILLMAEVLPLIDPKRKNYQNFKQIYTMFYAGIAIIIIGIQVVSLLQVFEIETINLLPILMGTMFAFLGNFFPKIKANFFMGIKTPWALSDEENWNYTHRIGGRYWFFGGILMMFTALLPVSLSGKLSFVIVMVVTLMPMIYSYLFYRRKERGKKSC